MEIYIRNDNLYNPLTKLFEFVNNFNSKHIKQLNKMNSYDILPIIEGAFRFDSQQLWNLFIYLFYFI